jgi:hypothetical protein
MAPDLRPLAEAPSAASQATTRLAAWFCGTPTNQPTNKRRTPRGTARAASGTIGPQWAARIPGGRGEQKAGRGPREQEGPLRIFALHFWPLTPTRSVTHEPR